MLTQQELFDHITYNPNTGEFYWITPGYGRVLSKPLHSCNARGYLRVQINKKRDYLHRLAFLYMIGEYPKNQVDHINGCKTDNRWCNLRDVTHGINQANKHTPSRQNIVGLMGVSQPQYGKYQAKIGYKGKVLCLGSYLSAEEAHAAYLKARLELRGC